MTRLLQAVAINTYTHLFLSDNFIKYKTSQYLYDPYHNT